MMMLTTMIVSLSRLCMLRDEDDGFDGDDEGENVLYQTARQQPTKTDSFDSLSLLQWPK